MLHDASLFGIESKDGAFNILMEADDNNLVELRFTGIVELKLDNFRKGNIVLDFFRIIESSAIQSQLEVLYKKPKIDNEKLTRFMSDTVGRILKDELKLIGFSESYGCHGLILCEEMMFRASRI
jgi:hypothetical protein